jgi:hypothetical protein
MQKITIPRKLMIELWEDVLDKYLNYLEIPNWKLNEEDSGVQYPTSKMMEDTVNPILSKEKKAIRGHLVEVTNNEYTCNSKYLKVYKALRANSSTDELVTFSNNRILALVKYINPNFRSIEEYIKSKHKANESEIISTIQNTENDQAESEIEEIDRLYANPLQEFVGLWKGFTPSFEEGKIRVHYWKFSVNEQGKGIVERGSGTAIGSYKGTYYFEATGKILSMLLHSVNSNMPKTHHFLTKWNNENEEMTTLRCYGTGIKKASPEHRKEYLIKVPNKPFEEIPKKVYRINISELPNEIRNIAIPLDIKDSETYLKIQKQEVNSFLDIREKRPNSIKQLLPKIAYSFVGIVIVCLGFILYLSILKSNNSTFLGNIELRKPDSGDLKTILLKDTNTQQYWVSYNQSNALKDTTLPFNKVQWRFYKENGIIKIDRKWLNLENKNIITNGTGWSESINGKYHFYIDLADDDRNERKQVSHRHFICEVFNTKKGDSTPIDYDTLKCICTVYNTPKATNNNAPKDFMPSQIEHFVGREILIRQVSQDKQDSTRTFRNLMTELPLDLRKWLGDFAENKDSVKFKRKVIKLGGEDM